jgi:hypothetical protein
MPRFVVAFVVCATLLIQGASLTAQTGKTGKKISTKKGLQPLNELVGQWKGTGVPKGNKTEIQKGFWVETMDWVWKFKGDDAWLEVTIDKGKYFTKGEMRYLPDQDKFQLTLHTTDKKTVVFTGTFEDKTLTVERDDPATKESQKLVFRLLHSNRFLYMYDVQPDGKSFFTRQYQVGATRLGEEFASGDGRPECIVTGGLGTSPVSYQGKTYYVCCSGCREEFYREPQKYIKLAEEKKNKK